MRDSRVWGRRDETVNCAVMDHGAFIPGKIEIESIIPDCESVMPLLQTQREGTSASDTCDSQHVF